MQPVKTEHYLAYPSDNITDLTVILTQKLNYYNSILIERTCQFHEAVARFVKDPSLVIVTNILPNGQAQTMTIQGVCESRLMSLDEIISLAETTAKILEQAKAGNFSKFTKELKVPELTISSKDMNGPGADQGNKGGTKVPFKTK